MMTDIMTSNMNFGEAIQGGGFSSTHLHGVSGRTPE
jgi:hypothetical protein